MNQLKMGFTLIELLISALIISFISGSIIYGIVLTDRSLRNEALKEFAFITLSNKMEELKAQTAANRVTNQSGKNKMVCIEYKTINDMLKNVDNKATCQTMGRFSYNVKPRKVESVHARVFDIDVQIKWRTATLRGGFVKDTSLSMTGTQLVFN